MIDLSHYDPNSVSNPENNIFGLPTTEENSALVILPVPWEVTVSYTAGTARAPEAVFKAGLQVDLFDDEFPDAWKQGYFMRMPDKKILMKSDYLRREAELYIDYISRGEKVAANQFMCKTIREINDGGHFLNTWVFEQTRALLSRNKLVGLLGGDHSAPLGYMKAIADKHGDFGILLIDAHMDMRDAYEGFQYSHASIMYNVLKEIPQVSTVVMAGIRDYGSDEWVLANKSEKLKLYADKNIRHRIFEGENWKTIAEEMVGHLPQLVYISFDIDGLDRKLCPFTGTPVPGGFELEQVFFLFSAIHHSGRKIIGFDLVEVGIGGDTDWDANVGARVLYKLCNLLVTSNANPPSKGSK